jgi:hypothetical protein
LLICMWNVGCTISRVMSLGCGKHTYCTIHSIDDDMPACYTLWQLRSNTTRSSSLTAFLHTTRTYAS